VCLKQKKESNLQLCVEFHDSRNANKSDKGGEGDLCQERSVVTRVLKVLCSKERMRWRTWNLEGGGGEDEKRDTKRGKHPKKKGGKKE
jgi:hypothetical protein